MTTEILAEKTFNLLEKTGLNWSVNRLPLFTEDKLPTESFGIFRNDNNEWLGTVGKRYVEMQNSTLAETIIKASEGVGLTTDRGGMLDGGRLIYLQAALPDEFIGKSNVRRLITALNSHDGSTSIAFGSSNTVVVCKNTFYRAYGELQKFRHTISAEQRIDIAMKDLRITMELDEKLMTTFKRMADFEMKDEIVDRVIRKIFDVKADADTSNMSTRKKNQIEAFGLATRTSIAEQGNTVWALFNGVTRYANHMQGYKDANKRLEYLMAGTGYDIMNDSYTAILKWVEENTVKDLILV